MCTQIDVRGGTEKSCDFGTIVPEPYMIINRYISTWYSFEGRIRT